MTLDISATNPALRAIVVGSGFGCRIQVPALRAAGFDVVGLVGTNLSRTSARAAINQVPNAFTDLKEAVTLTGAGTVAIAAPPYEHSALSLTALSLGCHVLCEKPFAISVAEAQALLDSAERTGKVHMLGHEFRFVPQRALVARVIAQGLIGEPRFLSLVSFGSYVKDFASDLPRWWFDPAMGGGWLGASGSHVIDQIRTEIGEFASVSADLTKVSDAAERIEDSFAVRFRLMNGASGIIQQSSGAWGSGAGLYRVAGTQGTLWTEGDAVWLADGEGTRELPIPGDLILPPVTEPLLDPRHEGTEWQFLTSHEIAPYTRLCEVLRARIEGKSSPSPAAPATFADGLACMKVIDAIRESAREDGIRVAIN
ncbi:MAG TPA: Gfo/Idh/MocA family oxidoreductase [Sphingobium sp.]|uniref:Gfo/Idh/MocA family protein n=1 Tax=Sphingobium sp. TaxID=1912891 RepID=UPI002ED4BA40